MNVVCTVQVCFENIIRSDERTLGLHVVQTEILQPVAVQREVRILRRPEE